MPRSSIVLRAMPCSAAPAICRMGVRHFVHHSRLVREILAPYLPRQARFHDVPMAVAAEQAPPVAVARNQAFVMVGRLSPEKGPLLFVQAAAQAGVHPVFVGDGRARDAVMVTVPDAEVTELADEDRSGRAVGACACTLVFPSLGYETFGLTVAEALARGVPAIVLRPQRAVAAGTH